MKMKKLVKNIQSRHNKLFLNSPFKYIYIIHYTLYIIQNYIYIIYISWNLSRDIIKQNIPLNSIISFTLQYMSE